MVIWLVDVIIRLLGKVISPGELGVVTRGDRSGTRTNGTNDFSDFSFMNDERPDFFVFVHISFKILKLTD